MCSRVWFLVESSIIIISLDKKIRWELVFILDLFREQVSFLQGNYGDFPVTFSAIWAACLLQIGFFVLNHSIRLVNHLICDFG